MDNFTYKYEYDPVGSSTNSGSFDLLKSNKLYHVNDNITSSTYYTEDIDDMGTFLSSNVATDNNFTYDAIGNLKTDKSEFIGNIEWTVYGKIKKIIRSVGGGNTKPNLEFAYGPDGNRIRKIVKPRDPSTGAESLASDWTTTYYVRDARFIY
jgi:hypothetical protein|tara:strand:+ start:11305 stop:11760 length:456 start_codon:yes stop_codon:yes gene_type:complete